MSVIKIVGLLAMSLLIPPLGLWPGIKLLFKNDRKGQAVGLAAIFLTAVSIAITVWFTIGFINSQMESLQGQLQFQNPGL